MSWWIKMFIVGFATALVMSGCNHGGGPDYRCVHAANHAPYCESINNTSMH